MKVQNNPITTGKAGQTAQSGAAQQVAQAPAKPAAQQSQDVVAQSGTGAPVVVQQPDNGQSQQVGRPNGGKPSKELKKLSAEQLKQVAGIGGAGIKGTGKLKGELSIKGGKAYLITAAKGSKSEVKFQLSGISLRDLEGLEGKKVSIEGNISKQSAWGGKIEKANLVGETAGPTLKVGSYYQLSGKIQNRENVAIGGEAAPSGAWLVLDTPAKIGGKAVKELFVQSWDDKFSNGAKATLNGRVDENTYGGVETPKKTYFQLSGVTNPAAGEPTFDGKDFKNAQGDKLEVLHYNRPLIMDAPAKIFVLDPQNGKAFIGSMGGFIPPEFNPFHGLSGSAKIDEATDADRGKVKFNQQGEAISVATGKKLALIGEREAPNHPDAMGARWFLDEDKNTVYQFVSGGIAGFNNRMTSVIKLGESDV